MMGFSLRKKIKKVATKTVKAPVSFIAKKTGGVATSAKARYAKIASTRQGQVAIALASHANPVSAAITSAAPVTSGIFTVAKSTGAVNSLLSPGARRAAGKTFGKYYVLGASKLTGGASDKALAIAGASGYIDKIAPLADLAEGYVGEQPEQQIGAQEFTGYEPQAGEVENGFPPVLLVVGALVALLVVIYLRK